jgi:hypothetical protein
MVTIWKYPLEIKDDQIIQMPGMSKILSVGLQGSIPCLWALVNTDNTPIEYHIYMFGTGQPLEYIYLLQFLGTLILHNEHLVCHVYSQPDLT